MQTKDAIRAAMDISDMVFRGFINDLSESDMMRRPGPGCNHLKWQCGHLIASEVWLVNAMLPGKSIDLPPGFAEVHSKQNSHSDHPASFGSKADYIGLMDKTRAATLKALDELPDRALDQPAPEPVRSFCPTIGHLFRLIGTHSLMHSGQAVPIRRQLQKPYVFF